MNKLIMATCLMQKRAFFCERLNVPALRNRCIQTNCKFLLLAVLSCFFISGCSWLNSDAKEAIEAEDDFSETLIAPIANFTSSTHNGNAPLVVDFVDVSTAGSASIDSWLWDFGNGDTSNQQNPSYTYSEQGSYTVALTVTTADGSNTVTIANTIEVLTSDVIITLAVVGIDGAKLDNANALSNSLAITSQNETVHGLQVHITPSQEPSVVRIEKTGYIPGLVYFDSIELAQTQAVTLLERADPIKVNFELGGIYVGENGITVDFSGGSFVKLDGSEAFGEGQLYITAVDTSQRRTLNAFPGSFLGTQDNSETLEELFTYGVADISFEQDGEILALKDDKNATLTLPLYASKDSVGNELSSGDIIPLWYLNEDTGVWHYESNGSVVQDAASPTGISLVANTRHFTKFNADINPVPIGNANDNPVGGGGSPRACLLDLELIGAEIDRNYLYSLEYLRPFQPSSRRGRNFRYQGTNLSHYIALGYVIRADVSDGTKAGSTTFSCITGETVYAQIELENTQPEFRYFDVETIPNFTLNSNNEYEILSNTLRVGAYFINAFAATFTSDLLPTPLILGSDIYHDVTYTNDQANTGTILGTINHNEITVEATDDVSFIAQSPPISSYYYAHFESSSYSTILSWLELAGADDISVYQLDNDPDAQGSLLHSGPLLNLTDNQLSFVGEIKGYFRIEISNQYGVESRIVRISEHGCPPFTDLCSPPA